MTPVISPWVFYLMSVVDGLKDFLIAALVGGFIYGIWSLVNLGDSYDDDERTKCLKGVKKALCAGVTIGILLVFTPSSNTITKMLIAQNVTYERVEMATDTVQSVYEDIMGLFEEDDNG